jgi:hypothetical protein
MTNVDRDFFAANGYLSLGQILAGEQLQRAVQLFDHDRSANAWSWKRNAHHQTINCDALVTSPAFDSLIRHPAVLPAVATLMGGPICFSEICVRHMASFDGEPYQGWHRDRPRWDDHPLAMDYIQLMLYLSDVDEATHCFSISPEQADGEQRDQQEQLTEGGIVDLHGPAGTAILFNIAVLHTATVRVTQQERKSVQVYYGHRHRPVLSNDSTIPATLWRDDSEAETRAFYGNLNEKTRRYLAAFCP